MFVLCFVIMLLPVLLVNKDEYCQLYLPFHRYPHSLTCIFMLISLHETSRNAWLKPL